MELYQCCAESLYALAKKEKNLRSKRYFTEQAERMASHDSEMDVVIHLYDLVMHEGKNLKESSK